MSLLDKVGSLSGGVFGARHGSAHVWTLECAQTPMSPTLHMCLDLRLRARVLVRAGLSACRRIGVPRAHRPRRVHAQTSTCASPPTPTRAYGQTCPPTFVLAYTELPDTHYHSPRRRTDHPYTHTNGSNVHGHTSTNRTAQTYKPHVSSTDTRTHVYHPRPFLTF